MARGESIRGFKIEAKQERSDHILAYVMCCEEQALEARLSHRVSRKLSTVPRRLSCVSVSCTTL